MNNIQNLGARLGIMDSVAKKAYKEQFYTIAAELLAHTRGHLEIDEDKLVTLNRKYKEMDMRLYPSRYGISGPTKDMFREEVESEGAKLIAAAAAKGRAENTYTITNGGGRKYRKMKSRIRKSIKRRTITRKR